MRRSYLSYEVIQHFLQRPLDPSLGIGVTGGVYRLADEVEGNYFVYCVAFVAIHVYRGTWNKNNKI